MKKKYQSLSKEEKKKAIEKYYQTDLGKVNKIRFIRLIITGILCILWGFFMIIFDIINKNYNIWNYISASLLIMAGIVFLVGRHKVLVRDLNNYLTKKKK